MATGKTYNSIDSKEQLILVQTGKGKFGGYKQDLLVNTLNELEIEFYVCTQCKGVMHNACQVGEEQIPNCETCIGNKARSQPMMKARHKIPQLKANCPLATRGCRWNATLSEIETHLDVCQEFLVKCNYDCEVILIRCELNDHCSNECLNREVSCEHCLNKIVYRDLNRHYEECLEFPLLCPNSCGANLIRKQTDSHIETDCPNTIVKCLHEKFGCKEVIKRCELNNHCSNECLNREVSCEHCLNKIVYRDLNRHYEECLEFPLLCPNSCGANLIRKQTDSHIETDCPNTIVKCLHEKFGCKEVIKRCEMEEHNKTNEIKHLKMTTLFAVTKIEQLEETNTKLSKEVNKLTNKLEQSDRRMEPVAHRIEDLERQSVTTIDCLECWMKERVKVSDLKQGAEKQSAIIESLTYPVVLQDTLKESDFNLMRSIFRRFPITRFEISWRFINLILIFSCSSQETISVSIIMDFNKVMSPLEKWPFEGRFKLTIIDRVNTNKYLAYESPVVKLQPKPNPEQGFKLKEENPDRIEIARIPIELLLEDRFRTEKGDGQFTLQIQEAEHVRL